jgi:hypothetical protein
MAFPALARAGLDKHVVRRLYLFWSERPDVWVDITDTVERKLAALAAHASQIREPAKLEQRIREWAAEDGQPVGVGAAEALRLILIEEDDELVEGGMRPRISTPRGVRRLGASTDRSGQDRPRVTTRRGGPVAPAPRHSRSRSGHRRDAQASHE